MNKHVSPPDTAPSTASAGSRTRVGTAAAPPAIDSASTSPVVSAVAPTRTTPHATFFVTELGDTSMDAHQREITDVMLDEGAGGDAQPRVPKELRGLVNPDRFKLPLIHKDRRGRRALSESASPRGISPSRRPYRSDAQSARKEAMATVEQQQRQGSQTHRGTQSMFSAHASITTLLVPQPPKDTANGNSLGKHLSSATQKYLHSLGFDDNPSENPEQKYLRHHGRAVISRVASKAENEPSLRIV